MEHFNKQVDEIRAIIAPETDTSEHAPVRIFDQLENKEEVHEISVITSDHNRRFQFRSSDSGRQCRVLRNDHAAVLNRIRNYISAKKQARNKVAAKSMPSIRIVPYRSLTIGPCIGCGNFGQVFLASLHSCTVVVKKIGSVCQTTDQKNAWKEEIALIASFNAPSIVRVFGVCNNLDDTHWLVMEHLPITLYQKLKDLHGSHAHETDLYKPCKSIDPVFRVFAAKYIASALVYLHNREYIYRDLRSDNMMVRLNNETVLIDFGMCARVSQGVVVTRNFCTDRRITPPEGMTTEKSDSFCFGLIMYELYTGARPYPSDDPLSVWYPDFERQVLAPSMDDSEEYVKLMKECCSRDASLRPSSTEILDRLELMHEALLVVPVADQMSIKQESLGYKEYESRD